LSGTWGVRFRLWARALQRRVLVALLAMLHLFSFGVMWLLLRVFNRRALQPEPPGWLEATGYNPEEPECNHPS